MIISHSSYILFVFLFVPAIMERTCVSWEVSMEQRQSKSLYVLKSCQDELKDLEAKKKSETKNLDRKSVV